MQFEHETLGQRVRFATGQADAGVAAEAELLGAERVMVVTSPGRRELAETVSAGVPVAMLHDQAVMHVPAETAQTARKVAASSGADLVLSVGGGSAVGLAKAIALTAGLPIIAVPTTYAGSEATDVWGMTQDGVKTTGSDRRVLPRAVVYDAALMLSLPVELSVASGLNAVAHCVDSLWAPRADPINTALASEAIRALSQGLPQITADPRGIAGREQALYGAYLAAVAFASAGSALHHKICHVLGGRYNLPHAQTHAIVLPHVLALNAPHAPDAEHRIATALSAGGAVQGLTALYLELNAPGALRDLGLEESQIAAAAAAILPAVPASNPAPVTQPVLEQLLHQAWEGSR